MEVPNYCRYLVGETNMVFCLLISHLEKSLDFVLKKILASLKHSASLKKKSHEQKEECAFCHKSTIQFNPAVYFGIE